MSEKRKDNRGRILRDGESQRKDGRYMFRYTDLHGKRVHLYAPTLEELREKEKEAARDRDDGIDYSKGSISLIQLAEMYTATKRKVRYNTRAGYQFVINLMKKYDFCYKEIKSIKPSAAKAFIADLYDGGYSYGTITAVRNVIKPALGMAVEDDIIRKNPFAFRIIDVVNNDAVKRQALNKEDAAKLLNCLWEDKCGKRIYNEIVILLGTGLRVSELYGLTKSDLDFKERRIRVERQLAQTSHGEYYIERPKTESGIRLIPMNEQVYNAFVDVLETRRQPEIEMMIGGCVGFLFLDKEKKPKVSGNLERALKRFMDRYNRKHQDKLPEITPHILRHTFCTNMANAGMDLKSLQYLMGHSDASTTLNTYSHNSYDTAKSAFDIINAKQIG